MGLAIAVESSPLRMLDDGLVRVANTCVTLDTIVATLQQGATLEEIVYPYNQK